MKTIIILIKRIMKHAIGYKKKEALDAPFFLKFK